MNNTVKVTLQDCSITKNPNPDGTDSEDILMTLTSSPTHSSMVTKIAHLLSILILQPLKVERNSKKNGTLYARWLLNFFQKKTWFILMNKLSTSQMSLISRESGNITESTSSSLDILIS